MAQSEPAPQVCPECGGDFSGRIVAVYSSTGAGHARDEWELAPMYEISIPEHFYKDDIIVFHVRGDSMEPSIKEGAFVEVDTQERDIIGGKVYAVWIPYEGVTMKMVFVDPENNQLILQSENPKHPEQHLPLDGRENLIIGRVRWVMQGV